MKARITRTLMLSLALCLGMGLSLSAQNEENTEVVIVQKITNDDGTETIMKKRVYNGTDAQSYLEENHDELSNMWDGSDEEGAEHFMIIRRDENGERKTELVIGMDGMEEQDEWEQNHEEVIIRHHQRKHHKSNKAFMGVYPEDNPNGEGVMLDGIVNYSGAQRAGLNTGDVMIAINENQLIEENDLGEVLSQFTPGEVVTVSYIRDGQTYTTELELTERSGYDRLERDPCQVFIGVSLGRQNAENGKGIHVSDVISNTSAERFGVQDGDIIVRLDDAEVNTYDELLIERNRHQAGEWYTLTVLRYGQEMDIEAQFNVCDEPVEELIEEPVVEEEVVEEVVEETPTVEELQDITNSLELLQFNAFPNPTYGNLRVEFRAEAQPTIVRIMDISGKVVFQENLQTFDGYYNKEVNLQGVAPGALFLTVQQEGKVMSEKVILLPRA